MHDYLSLRLQENPARAKARMFEANFSPAEIEEADAEAEKLSRHGLFEARGNFISSADTAAGMERAEIANGVGEAQLMLADECNLACEYCYCGIGRDVPSGGLMSLDTARSAVDFLFRQSGDELSITFFGGEPLLNKPVMDFVIEYSQELAGKTGKTINYIITTNATLLDDKAIDHIVRYNFGLMVSLDGPREIHDHQCPMRGGDGSYDLAVRNIRKLTGIIHDQLRLWIQDCRHTDRHTRIRRPFTGANRRAG